MTDSRPSFQIIDFAKARADRAAREPKPPKLVYWVRVEINDAFIMQNVAIEGLGDDIPPSMVRAIAEDMRIFSWWARDKADEMEPNPQEHLLAEARIYEGGRITTRVDPEHFDTPDQREWLARQLSESFGRMVDIVDKKAPYGEDDNNG